MTEEGRLKSLLKKIRLNESTISMVLGVLVIVVVGALIFNYFKGVSRFQPEKEEVKPEEIKLVEKEGKFFPEGLPAEYQVQKNDNLWKIAEKFYGSGYNWADIARENKLENPNIIFVDQKLNIPKTAVIKPLTAKMTIFGPVIEGDKYTVEKGDHLWGIAVRTYGDGYQWVGLAKVNNIANPNIIHPGNVLTLPR